MCEGGSDRAGPEFRSGPASSHSRGVIMGLDLSGCRGGESPGREVRGHVRRS